MASHTLTPTVSSIRRKSRDEQQPLNVSVPLLPGAPPAYDFLSTSNVNKSPHNNIRLRSSYRPISNLSVSFYARFYFAFIKDL
jgi:hypothetical protein